MKLTNQIKINLIKNTIALLVMTTFLFSCDNEDSNVNEFDGSIESVEQFFNADIIDALNELGFIFNTGGNPPAISGGYLASPFILQSSTVPGDINGSTFENYFINFFNQNIDNLTIDFTSDNGGQSSDGTGSFVSGTGNNFSVYLKANTTYQGETAKFAYAISGKMTSTGIEDFQFANLMLDDNGDPGGFWIENNTGRLLRDSDRFSPKQ